MLKIFIMITLLAVNVHAKDEHGSEGGHHQAKHHEPLFPPKVKDPSLATVLARTKLLEPAFEAKVSGSATLKWQGNENANAYHLQVATDPNFKWLVVNEPMYQGTTFELQNLEAGKHYYWRVAALKTNNNAGYQKGWFGSSMLIAK